MAITENPIREGIQLDGYELIRPIGAGGFGQVWLCRTFTGNFKALKIMRGSFTGEIEREFHGLVAYRDKTPWLNCNALSSAVKRVKFPRETPTPRSLRCSTAYVMIISPSFIPIGRRPNVIERTSLSHGSEMGIGPSLQPMGFSQIVAVAGTTGPTGR